MKNFKKLKKSNFLVLAFFITFLVTLIMASYQLVTTTLSSEITLLLSIQSMLAALSLLVKK